MTRGRRDDSAAHAPASFYIDEMPIVRMAPFVRALLRAMNVPPQDWEDLVQEVTAGAWLAMTQGRFRPLPGQPLGDALKLWLAGITWRQVSHYREKAHRRREVPDAAPWGVRGADDWLPHLPATAGIVEARDILRALDLITEAQAEILLMRYGERLDVTEIAEALDVKYETARARLRAARLRFIAAAENWQRVRS
ncbi:RNA polymerase sigma factor [Chondromyces apiculatus]|uniref:RNA polymerase sigma factor 70 region 4 type 2 domain-containing protein n=1 Tax=Chondromyces apiculatus DSM 436 TaxID=1192034 RepID=A0A017TF94_9BACT|nr:RNA polymerase sigma factor [Chondromyces apiculatus]EYF07490.1 Hypothetical protein CAP_0243 [Chondromyces apiculatus DSM 436]